MKLAEYQVRKLTEQLDRIVVERDQLRAALASWQEAFGLLTTLKPDMEIDITDPLGMARAIERHVLAQRAALAAANARITELETQLAATPVKALRRYYEYSDMHLAVRCGDYDNMQSIEDCRNIDAWLARSEVQP